MVFSPAFCKLSGALCDSIAHSSEAIGEEVDATFFLTMILIALLLANLPPIGAYQYSQTNCTIPQQELHNFVSAPNIRSTLDIFWSCLATVIACTYTVLHLNVPEQHDGKEPSKGWKARIRRWWKGVSPSAKWTAITLLAPEVYTTSALEGFLDARTTLKELASLPADSCPDPEWSLVHAFHINMGGFAIRTAVRSNPHEPGKQETRSLETLKASCMVELLRCKYDDDGPTVTMPTKAEIQDRSKRDMFAKIIVTIQILYFCASCLTRAIRHLPLTLLELGTLGLAACSLVSYGLLFHKPHSIRSPIILGPFDSQLYPRIESVVERNEAIRKVSNFGSDQHPGHYILGIEMEWIIAVAMAAVLGGIHLAGWNFEFPSAVDKWIWRASSVASIAFALLFVASFRLLQTLEDESVGEKFFIVVADASALLYGVSRLLLIAEMIRCLFYLPPEAFTATWTADIPRFG